MNKTVEAAFQKAQISEIYVDDSPRGLHLEIRNASLLWCDFTGKITKYNTKLGEKRTFNIVLNDQMLNVIRNLEQNHPYKIRIHEADLYSADDLEKDKSLTQFKVLYINVKVNIKSQYPPTFNLFTTILDQKLGTEDRKKNTLTGDGIGILDRMDIMRADCTLNIYQSDSSAEFASSYLRKIFVEQVVQKEFGDHWDAWEDKTDDDGKNHSDDTPDVAPEFKNK